MRKFYFPALAYLMVMFAFSCKHDVLNKTAIVIPSISTANISSVTNSSALSGGNVTTDGGATVTARGVCWSLTTNPTIAGNKTTDGSGSGSFTSTIAGLSASTTYYVRAYATNSAGTAYGDQKTFTTSGGGGGVVIPSLTTANATATANSIATGGNVTSDGGAAVSARGVCWSTTTNPTIAGNKTTDGSGIGSFVSSITGLSASTTYYVRAYATNSAGTAYGDQKTATTTASGGGPVIPSVTTASATSTATTIATGGNVTADGGATVAARGVCWSTTTNPTIAGNKTTDGSGTGSFTSSITGLSANTTYYVRAYATNSAGTAYGNQLTVVTSASSPYTIGQSFGGGIIFYIDGTGIHGLIAATQDVGVTSGTRWDHNSNTVLLGVTSNTNGRANTLSIVAALGIAQTYAALLCVQYNAGGFTDWFLPAKDELNLLYQQRTVVGGLNNTSGNYWSSTEDDKNKAWLQQFASGSNSGRLDNDNKDKLMGVRPVRSF